MKKLLFIFFLFCSNYSYSQFNNTSGVDWYHQADVCGSSIAKVGIGEFKSNGDEPQSALDVRVPYLFRSGFPDPQFPSEAFQTTTERDYGTLWRIYSGAYTPDREERFRIYNQDPNNIGVTTTPFTPVIPYATRRDVQITHSPTHTHFATDLFFYTRTQKNQPA